ncbi:MAG TPA: glycosyltransferase family 1 protein [Candidatus Hydrogenedentes bacterium]|nr:glycosyltransferase family 1 protein [Candidatus Hydrogenedentota bacterium]
MVRLAFVDLIFSWPPNGGADIDCHHVISGLQRAGHDVHLFVAHERESTERGRVDPADLPFPATRLDFTRRTLRADRVARAFQEAVDAWRPDIVFLMHGFALKPHVALALAHHRTVSRYYAHELACARDALRFKDGAPCPNDYLRTPDLCRRCALDHQRQAIRQWRFRTWTADYLAARAYAPAYHAQVLAALRTMDAVMVYHGALRTHLEGLHDNVLVIPGGVSVTAVAAQAAPEKGPGDEKIIFMSGRADDPLKGLDTLLEAGRILWERRQDFVILATHFDATLRRPYFRSVPWRDHAGALALYAQADICAAPSIWAEPFGLTAVEAMAAGRPVCASRIGGLQDIVRHGETGFLLSPGDAPEWAKALEILLDNPALRREMGAAGRRVAETEYDWDRVIARHYLPLLERLGS